MEKDLKLLKNKKKFLIINSCLIIISLSLFVTFLVLMIKSDYDSPMYSTYIALYMVFLFVSVLLAIPLILICLIKGIETDYNGNHIFAVNGRKGFSLYINKELVDIDKSLFIFTKHNLTATLPSGEEVLATIYDSGSITLKVNGKLIK